jgi:hypothetical protein
MNAIIDLESEVLVDRSIVRNPHLRLLLTAFGQQLADGSPWVALDKKVAAADDLLVRLILRPLQRPAA